MGKNFYKRSDTYRKLLSLNQNEILSDLCDSLNGSGIIPVTIEDLRLLETEGKDKDRGIGYITDEIDDLSKYHDALSEIMMPFVETDGCGFILISGKLNDCLEILSITNDTISDITDGIDMTIVSSYIDRPEQDKYRITYFSF